MEQSTHVSDVLVRISALARHHDDRSLDVRRLQSFPIAAKRVIVDKREMVILASWISDLEVSNLRATPLRQRSRNLVSGILLRENGSTEEHKRGES